MPRMPAGPRVISAGPLRLAGSGWRALAYLFSGWLVATLWVAAVLVLAMIPALGLLVLLAGVPLGAVERWRLRLVDPDRVPSPHARLVRPGLWGWLAARFREPVTWRELGYGLLFSLGLAWLDLAVGLLLVVPLYLVGFPLLAPLAAGYQPEGVLGSLTGLPEALLVTLVGLASLPVVGYLLVGYALARAVLTRTLIGRGGPTGPEVLELTRSRARIMDAMDAQRRRIERDLHDGAQQRLTGLIMTLGMARLRLDGSPPAARELVDHAYRQARTTLAELRELVHGIHPQVLTDRGLAPAVAELADRCPVPVEVDIALPARPPEPVEAAAWFIIGEALTNVARHSRATRAWVRCRPGPGRLLVEVGDDGVGGADPARGTGLVGLTDRAAVLAGRLTLSSPAGGPTRLRAELPCMW